MQKNNTQNSGSSFKRLTVHSINYSQNTSGTIGQRLLSKSYTTKDDMKHDKFGGYKTKASSKTSIKRTVYDLRKLN